ncbi:MAG: ubiquinone biosynthesis protein UbiE [Deltaproteobacteria bacterium HGW-Deltaproteobacteria-21]|nr:MAG: ubiquinone biosynthesis protein UbiE [Deltaproteobacteria bacterium HGW-Deltaproteobacteria-21]
MQTNKSETVRRMFSTIASSYVLMNKVITFGMDSLWRRRLIRAASFPARAFILDVGSGTGDISLDASGMDRSLRPVAVDFTLEMMKEGRRRKGASRILWCCADASNLPFRDRTFDGVVSGYLLRNVEEVRAAVREQVRVVKPGGRIAALDTSPPPPGLLQPLVLLYFRFAIPFLGQTIARNRAAYEYLPGSTRAFLQPEKLAEIMEEEGLKNVRVQRFMLGTQVVLSGTRGTV